MESDDPAPGNFTAELTSMSKKSSNNNTAAECSNIEVSSKNDTAVSHWDNYIIAVMRLPIVNKL